MKNEKTINKQETRKTEGLTTNANICFGLSISKQ